MGAAEVHELGRILLPNVHHLLDDELSDPRLKGALAFEATLGGWLGLMSPNSVLPWLVRPSGRTGGVQGGAGLAAGGMAALGTAMARAAEAKGVTLRCGTRVQRILVMGERVGGVVLESGEELRTGRVVSAIAPRTTLLSLVGARHLDAGLTTSARHLKALGGAAKLTLSLRALPDFRGADPKDRLIIAGSEHEVDRAFNPVKYGKVPERPGMEIVNPTAHGGAMEERHLLSAVVQFAPHDPVDRDAARATMLAASMARLEAHAPRSSGLVEEAELLMPYDIKARYGLPGGQWHAGELSVEPTLFLRPLPGIAQYRVRSRASGSPRPGVIRGAASRARRAGTLPLRWRLRNDGSLGKPAARRGAACENTVPPLPKRSTSFGPGATGAATRRFSAMMTRRKNIRPSAIRRPSMTSAR